MKGNSFCRLTAIYAAFSCLVALIIPILSTWLFIIAAWSSVRRLLYPNILSLSSKIGIEFINVWPFTWISTLDSVLFCSFVLHSNWSLTTASAWFINNRPFSAKCISSVVIIPPSPAVMCLPWVMLKHPIWPNVPVYLVEYSGVPSITVFGS